MHFSLLLACIFGTASLSASAFAFSGIESPEDHEFTQCMNLPESENKVAIDYCHSVASRGRNKNRYNFEAMKKGCDRGSEQLCSGLLMNAGAYGSSLYPELLRYSEDNCTGGNRRTCATLSGHYEDLKKMPQALKYAKMHFDRFQEGPYIYMAYKHGDKADAMKKALNECRRDKSRCLFYLRYMPDHPQHSEIAKNAEQDCLALAPYTSSGATSCTIIGTFHYKQGAYSKALELWSRDCLTNGNRLACQLIMGSEHSSQEKKLGAGLVFCSDKKESYIPTLNLRKQFCSEVTGYRRVPASLEFESKSLVQQFLQEQK